MTEPRKSQRERFEEAARELGVDLDEEKLKKVLRGLGDHRPPKERDLNDDASK